MNKQLQNKLKTYSALTGAAAFLASSAKAEIIHTTINYTGGYETYDIDIDNDGNIDFTINANQQSYSFTYNSQPITIEVGYVNLVGNIANLFVGGSGVASTQGFTYPYNYASNLAAGILVNNTYNPSFVSYGFLAGKFEAFTTFYGFPVLLGGFELGKFGDGGEYFVGTEFEIPSTGDIHYAWLRFKDVEQDGSSWTLADMAYETTAGVGIPTGNTVSIKENNSIEFTLSNVTDGLMLSNTSSLINADVKLTDAMGKVVFESSITSNELFIQNNYPSGIYFLTVNHKGKAISRKVMF